MKAPPQPPPHDQIDANVLFAHLGTCYLHAREMASMSELPAAPRLVAHGMAHAYVDAMTKILAHAGGQTSIDVDQDEMAKAIAEATLEMSDIIDVLAGAEGRELRVVEDEAPADPQKDS